MTASASRAVSAAWNAHTAASTSATTVVNTSAWGSASERSAELEHATISVAASNVLVTLDLRGTIRLLCILSPSLERTRLARPCAKHALAVLFFRRWQLSRRLERVELAKEFKLLFSAAQTGLEVVPVLEKGIAGKVVWLP